MTVPADPLEWVEDFRAAWAGGTGAGHQRLRAAMRAAMEEGRALGGLPCCGTRTAWHRPWCATGPRRARQPAG